MNPVAKRLCWAALVAATSVGAEPATPGHVGRYEGTPKDTEAIMQVTRDFRAAIVEKDPKKLSGLLLNSRILFSSPASPERTKKVREDLNVHYDGIDTAGAVGFLDFIGKTKEPVEEKFYNIKITQDRHVAWVMFDYEFLENNAVQNYGVETWQLVKTPEDKWKILSVVWSSHGAPK